jgi:hypothetical protein
MNEKTTSYGIAKDETMDLVTNHIDYKGINYVIIKEKNIVSHIRRAMSRAHA